MSDACAEILQDFCSQFYNCYINRGLFSKLALRNISSCIKAQDLFVAASKLTAASCMYLLCIFRSRIMFVFGVCRNEHIALMLYAVYMFVIGQKIEQVRSLGQCRIPYVFVQIAIQTRCVGKVYHYAGVQL